MTHVMVDLETWGTTPGSDIRSIGAVEFDPVTGTLGDEFYVNVAGGDVYGLVRDPETEKFWDDQSAEARQAFDAPHDELSLGLGRFGKWWADRDPAFTDKAAEPTTFWANGPHFDEAILGACYRATDLLIPWHYRAPRDCRTIWEAAGGVDLPFEGVKHNALDDAKHQARCVIEAYRKLREPAETVTKFRRLLNPVWMQLLYNAMGEQPARDEQFIFTFMGAGGSDMTTVADFREVMGDERKAIEEMENYQPDDGPVEPVDFDDQEILA